MKLTIFLSFLTGIATAVPHFSSRSAAIEPAFEQLELAGRADNGGNVEVWTDCKYQCNGKNYCTCKYNPYQGRCTVKGCFEDGVGNNCAECSNWALACTLNGLPDRKKVLCSEGPNQCWNNLCASGHWC